MKKIYRYCSDNLGVGGIVMAENSNESVYKIKTKYNDYTDFSDLIIWDFTTDEYYDENNTDVVECYGMQVNTWKILSCLMQEKN